MFSSPVEIICRELKGTQLHVICAIKCMKIYLARRQEKSICSSVPQFNSVTSSSILIILICINWIKPIQQKNDFNTCTHAYTYYIHNSYCNHAYQSSALPVVGYSPIAFCDVYCFPWVARIAAFILSPSSLSWASFGESSLVQPTCSLLDPQTIWTAYSCTSLAHRRAWVWAAHRSASQLHR